MEDKLKKHIDKMLELYTSGDFSDTVLQAKKEYSDLTGSLSDEDEGYESRMSCFNDWYLFHYPFKEDMTFAQYYASTNEINREIENALNHVHYSVFYYAKDNLRKKMVIKDLMFGRKITIDEESGPGIVVGDVFIGRTIQYKGSTYLLRGIALIPSTVKGIIKKEAKRVRKQANPQGELSFLYKVEALAIKSLRYNHVSPEKIFVFHS